MDFRRHDAGRGLVWLTEAVEILLRNPGPFLLMGLLVAMLASLPVLGALVLSIFGPSLNGGVIYAAREQAAGRPAEFGHLFRAFNESSKLPRMLLLCLPGIAAGFVIGMLAVTFIGSALLAAGISQATDADALTAVSLGGGGLVFTVAALAVGLLAFSLVFFATPLVMLDGVEPFAMMKLSLAAAWANALPIIIYVLGVLFAAMLITAVLGALSVHLAQIAVITIAFPVAATVMWVAARDVFGEGRGAESGDAPTAPPSIEA